MKRSILIFIVGIFTGLVTSFMALNLHRFLSQYYHLVFFELNMFSIILSSMGACLLAAFLYATLDNYFNKPKIWFGIIVSLIACLDCIWMILYFPVPNFIKLANPLHLMVAFSSILFVPFLYRFLKKN